MTRIGHDPRVARMQGPTDDLRPTQGRFSRQATTRRKVIEWTVLIVAAVIVAVLVRTFVFQTFYIPSDSMVPKLETHDRIIVNKLSYKLHDVHRGDVIVFQAPPELRKETPHLVKRVVGLPGDMIEGRNGRIFINGKRLDEPYLSDTTRSKRFGPERVPDGRYFVLGDNRMVSEDSTVFHSIPKEWIVGRAFVRIWPLSRVGFL